MLSQFGFVGMRQMKKTFEEVVLFARTGLNPRQNFKLGQGNNNYITIKNIKVLVVCGSNKELYNKLKENNNSKLEVLGFTRNINDLIKKFTKDKSTEEKIYYELNGVTIDSVTIYCEVNELMKSFIFLA